MCSSTPVLGAPVEVRLDRTRRHRRGPGRGRRARPSPAAAPTTGATAWSGCGSASPCTAAASTPAHPAGGWRVRARCRDLAAGTEGVRWRDGPGGARRRPGAGPRRLPDGDRLPARPRGGRRGRRRRGRAAAAGRRRRPTSCSWTCGCRGMDGVEATRRICAGAAPGRPRVLVLTTFDLEARRVRRDQAGASGFLLKDVPPEELLAAIRVVAPATRWSRRRSPGGCSTGSPAQLGPGAGRRIPGWPSSPRASARCCCWSPRACPTPRSPNGCRRGGDGEDPRRADPGQAPAPRPGAGRRLRLRDAGWSRPRLTRRTPQVVRTPGAGTTAGASRSSARAEITRGAAPSVGTSDRPSRHGAPPFPHPPTPGVALAARALSKVYGAAHRRARAGRRRRRLRRRAVHRHHGPVRLRQVDAMHCLAGLTGHHRRGAPRRHRAHRACDDRALTRLRRDRVGFVFQSFNLLPMLDARGEHPAAAGARRPRPDPAGSTQVVGAGSA